MRIALFVFRTQAHRLHHGGDGLLALLACADTVHIQWLLNDIANRHSWIKGTVRVLEHDLHVPTEGPHLVRSKAGDVLPLSLIHISEPTRLGMISYAVFCLKKK